MKRKRPSFSLWCHLEMNYRPNESAEVKLAEELNSPLIYYSLPIGIVSPGPDCSPLAFTQYFNVNEDFFFFFFFGCSSFPILAC